MPSDPARPGGPRYTPAQRRLLTATAGLVVAALAGGAYALTFDLLRDLAVAGRAGRRWAPVYPAMADALTAMTILSLVVTRNARWWTRLLRWTLLLVLVAGVAAISVQHSLRGFAALPGDPLRVGVAAAPHTMLVIAVWLWLTMFKQIRTARPAAGGPEPPETQRGHVKVIEAPRPELEAAPEPHGREPHGPEQEATPELDAHRGSRTRPELEARPGARPGLEAPRPATQSELEGRRSARPVFDAPPGPRSEADAHSGARSGTPAGLGGRPGARPEFEAHSDAGAEFDAGAELNAHSGAPAEFEARPGAQPEPGARPGAGSESEPLYDQEVQPEPDSLREPGVPEIRLGGRPEFRPRSERETQPQPDPHRDPGASFVFGGPPEPAIDPELEAWLESGERRKPGARPGGGAPSERGTRSDDDGHGGAGAGFGPETDPEADGPEERPGAQTPPDPPALTPPARLPTDVELVRSRARDTPDEKRVTAGTTRPDLVMPAAPGAEGDEHDAPPADRPEDPEVEEEGRTLHRGSPHPAPVPDPERDAEESDDLSIWDWNPPPSSNFRSSPLPPSE